MTLIPPDLLLKVIGAIAGTATSVIKTKLERSEIVIRLLKQLNLDPEHPPADFTGVYHYALVEYGVGKPQPVLELFRQAEIQQAFRKAFDQNNPSLLLRQADEVLATYAPGDAMRSLGIDPRRELAAFATVFIEVAKRTRTPAQVLTNQQISSLHGSILSIQDRLNRLPTLEGIRTEMARLAEQSLPALPAAESRECRAFALAQQMRGWFETLGYRFEAYEVWEPDYFEWMLNIPVRRNRYDRILIRGIEGAAEMRDVMALQQSVQTQRADEGWLVTTRRISRAARDAVEKPENAYLGCYTLDELLDQDADFSGYLDWLAAEIGQRQIEQRYVPLVCTKEELDPVTQQRIAISRYGDRDGWIDGYLDQWLDDPAKEHISVLGEFGTGKTWFALHYAWVALQRYRDAQKRGVERPRLPLVIPLRDYAKAVSVESLFSEFFFRKHKIPIPHYEAFEQLNRMGKLLLIFDGFDEMAARVDRQQMINNFWQLAKVVVPGAKVILTCRTEHFPEAKEGRALLNAELQASTANLTGETPQFEVLELEKFTDAQIRQVLSLQAEPEVVKQVLGNPQLLDLARRPVMTELILEALPDIKAGKRVDMARVYLYAARRKMERDIKEERTFTSLADKLYFLCELSWEMLSTDQMSLNYREFPDRIRRLFASVVQEEKDLDHWHFDMMGQTMLIRNADGDYMPAHRSLLEFFVAYKFAAELGAIAPDFLELAQSRADVDARLERQPCQWSEYFGQPVNTPLQRFVPEDWETLRTGFGKTPLTKAVIDLMLPMLIPNSSGTTHPLLSLIQQTADRCENAVDYLGGNALTLLVKLDPDAIAGQDLSQTILLHADLTDANLQGLNLAGANLHNAQFTKILGGVLSLAYSADGKRLATGDSNGCIHLWDVQRSKVHLTFSEQVGWVYAIAFSPNNQWLASGSHDRTVRIWDVETGKCLKVFYDHVHSIWSVAFSPDGKFLASASNDCTIKIFDLQNWVCIRTLSDHTDCVRAIAMSPDGKTLVSTGTDTTLRHWDWQTGECIQISEGHRLRVNCVAFHPNGKLLASGSFDQHIRIWNLETGDCLHCLAGHSDRVRAVRFSLDGTILASCSEDNTIRLWNSQTGDCLKVFTGHTNSIWSLAFSPDNTTLASGGSDHTVRLWNWKTGDCLTVWQGRMNNARSANFSLDGQLLSFGQDDQLVQVWHLETGHCLHTIHAQSSRVCAVTFSPDSQILATASACCIQLWSLRSGTCLMSLQGHTHPIFAIAFSPDGTLIASGSDDRTVKLWHLSTGECRYTLQGHIDGVWSVPFSPDGSLLASGSCDQTIKVWTVETGECVNTLSGHTHFIRAVVFSPDGSLLASGSDDQTIRLWQVLTGECLQTFQGHNQAVWSLSFSPDGAWLASGSHDCAVKLWNIQTGECWHTFSHSAQIRAIQFSQHENHLIVACEDETTWFWDIKTQSRFRHLSNRPYEGLNITDAIGLSQTERITLRSLGAMDDQES